MTWTPPRGRRPWTLRAAILAASLLSAWPAPARSETTLSLEQTLRLARERSAAVLLARAESAAARAELREAGLRAADPELELAAGPRLGDRDRLELELAFRRPFEPRGAREARGAAGRARLDAAEARGRSAELELLAAAAEAHAGALHAQERLLIASEDVELAERLLAVARGRRELGEAGRLDESLALAALARSAAARARAAASLERRLGSLRALLGLAPDSALRVVGRLAPAGGSPSDPELPHPDLSWLLAQESEAEAERDLGLAAGRTAAAFLASAAREEGDTVLRAGVSISLPARERGAGRVEAAVARREGLRLARELERDRLAALAEGESRAAAGLAEAAEELDRVGLAALGEAAGLLREAYELGALPLTEILAARRELARARHERLDLLLDATLAAIRARLLAGQEPTP